MRQRAFAAEDQLARVKSERDQASQAKTQLVQKVAAQDLTKQADDKLISDLRAKLDTHDGDVSQDANRISVNLVDQILFKSGDANISPRGKKVLDQVGAVLKGLANKQILVGGHTDDRPIHTAQFPSNWELSTARAVNVVRYLAETVGVSPDKLTAAGFSQFHPRSKTSKAKNRRIEILLTPIVEVKKK
jgi:chemotaxis protein MotB